VEGSGACGDDSDSGSCPRQETAAQARPRIARQRGMTVQLLRQILDGRRRAAARSCSGDAARIVAGDSVRIVVGDDACPTDLGRRVAVSRCAALWRRANRVLAACGAGAIQFAVTKFLGTGSQVP
jgi:hypothetical protein